MKAVVLLSGGLDSATTLAVARAEGYDLYGLSFDYGQRHRRELRAAESIARFFACREWHIIPLALGRWGGSALTADLDVPTGRSLEEMSSGIPVTYVPARNTVFIAYGLSYAEAVDADAIFVGVNAIDYSGYPDCRPEYIRKFQELINLATKKTVEGGTIEMKTPLIRLTKAEIVKLGASLGVPFQLTWSCYLGGEKACGACDSCRLRLKGFAEAGVADPLEYEGVAGG